MSNLKQQLLRLGNTRPELRGHIQEVLKATKTAKTDLSPSSYVRHFLSTVNDGLRSKYKGSGMVENGVEATFSFYMDVDPQQGEKGFMVDQYQFNISHYFDRKMVYKAVASVYITENGRTELYESDDILHYPTDFLNLGSPQAVLKQMSKVLDGYRR